LGDPRELGIRRAVEKVAITAVAFSGRPDRQSNAKAMLNRAV
jgi:hypothetical protein